ncbi:MAG TPA: hypothetical protein VKM72_34230, partial [Thermoanaerobaculia bacterium]|nr:hypothetical protein [Thermoanaerobaculia bacterium]
TSGDRAKLIQTVVGIPVVDKTADSAADTSPTSAHLVEYSASSEQVNYDENLNKKESPVDKRSLANNAGYILESGGKSYVVLGSTALEAGRYYYPLMVLNHELDHVRQALAKSTLKGDESELDAWTSSFVRDFHRTYLLSETSTGSTCYVEEVSTWTPLLDYFRKKGVSSTQQDASVKRIKDYYDTTIKPHEGHKTAFRYWIYLSLKVAVTPNLAERLNTGLALGVDPSIEKKEGRKFTCGTAKTLAYSAPTLDKPTFPAPPPKPAKP